MTTEMQETELEAQYQKRVERSRFLKEAVYEPLKEDWNNYRAIQVGQDTLFLKTLSSFSAGAFGVSFAFINSIIKMDKAVYKNLLMLSWGCFALTIVMVLSCYIISSFIHGRRCDDVKNGIAEGYEGKPYTEKGRWYYGWVTSTLELLAFCGFLGGLGCLVSFVGMNL